MTEIASAELKRVDSAETQSSSGNDDVEIVSISELRDVNGSPEFPLVESSDPLNMDAILNTKERSANSSRRSSRRSSIAGIADVVVDAVQETNGQEGFDLLSQLTEEQREHVFNDEHQSSALHNLIICSILMFTVPCTVMYASYKLLFEGYYDMPPDQAALYSGILGVTTVYAIVIGFIIVAYREEKSIANRYKEIKSQ